MTLQPKNWRTVLEYLDETDRVSFENAFPELYKKIYPLRRNFIYVSTNFSYESPISHSRSFDLGLINRSTESTLRTLRKPPNTGRK